MYKIISVKKEAAHDQNDDSVLKPITLFEATDFYKKITNLCDDKNFAKALAELVQFQTEKNIVYDKCRLLRESDFFKNIDSKSLLLYTAEDIKRIYEENKLNHRDKFVDTVFPKVIKKVVESEDRGFKRIKKLIGKIKEHVQDEAYVNTFLKDLFKAKIDHLLERNSYETLRHFFEEYENEIKQQEIYICTCLEKAAAAIKATEEKDVAEKAMALINFIVDKKFSYEISFVSHNADGSVFSSLYKRGKIDDRKIINIMRNAALRKSTDLILMLFKLVEGKDIIDSKQRDEIIISLVEYKLKTVIDSLISDKIISKDTVVYYETTDEQVTVEKLMEMRDKEERENERGYKSEMWGHR